MNQRQIIDLLTKLSDDREDWIRSDGTYPVDGASFESDDEPLTTVIRPLRRVAG